LCGVVWVIRLAVSVDRQTDCQTHDYGICVLAWGLAVRTGSDFYLSTFPCLSNALKCHEDVRSDWSRFRKHLVESEMDTGWVIPMVWLDWVQLG